MFDPDQYDNERADPHWLAACGIVILVLFLLALFLWLFVESQNATAWECRETSLYREPSTLTGDNYVRRNFPQHNHN